MSVKHSNTKSLDFIHFIYIFIWIVFLSNGTSWGNLLNMRLMLSTNICGEDFLNFHFPWYTYSYGGCELYFRQVTEETSSSSMSLKLFWVHKIFHPISLLPFQPQIAILGGPWVPWEQEPKVHVTEVLEWKRCGRDEEGGRDRGLKRDLSKESRKLNGRSRVAKGENGSISNGRKRSRGASWRS